MRSKSQKEQKKVYALSPTNGSKEQNLFCTKKGQQIIYNYSQLENTHKTVQCFHSPTKRQSQQNQL